MSWLSILKRHEAAMNANNATDPYASPPATPVRPTPPELNRKRKIRVKMIVDSQGRTEFKKFYECSDTDGAELDDLAEVARLAKIVRLAAEPSPAAEPAPAAGADDA
jgi:hypothetical protein